MHEHELSTVKPLGLLSRQSGITLLETLAVVAVLAVMIVTVYIGIVYAERQLLTNYRDRVATLLVTGELEMEYYRHSRSKPFELQVNKQYVLDDNNPDRVVRGNMTIVSRNAQETSNEQLLNYIQLEATFRWIDPGSRNERYIRMREDYFIP
ncbi:MAG: prepilin-type N-terminal cleavage/methylation domain-containing protein [Candidatus Cloacimonetes bacterium]|jgi:Tfp pilus assembly protein PilE|nr:prepilin-type N-terminal cleavage/methylation domain-containing protein [Candidatus Cloacimonadota bacterium]MDD3142887.1 prepilin-type N-terminal cleavage/methylation domain-containing protein [Candidatus Cloacimonadota bacterium]MDY0366150.1 prepilin-type N-terminal cleavage/methylation domain-containing protein [Candidatus Syntrophosphaera sp.]HOY85196.1 prepilin-type N-terminal cleavage/methylation domain-containing protein [Candidatus Syntrophosphaera sp.]